MFPIWTLKKSLHPTFFLYRYFKKGEKTLETKQNTRGQKIWLGNLYFTYVWEVNKVWPPTPKLLPPYTYI